MAGKNIWTDICTFHCKIRSFGETVLDKDKVDALIQHGANIRG